MLALSTTRVAILGEITKRPSPRKSGTAVSMARLANALAAEGVAVDLVVRELNCFDAIPEPPRPPVRVVALQARSKQMLLIKLLGYLLKNKPSHLIARENRAIQVALWAKRLLGKRIKVWPAFHSELNLRIEPTGRLARVKLNRVARVVGLADGVITVSAGLAAQFRKLSGADDKSLHVIPNPVVSPNLYAQLSIPAELPPWTGVTLLAIGRLTEGKGYSTLLEAFASVKAKLNKPVRLVILGEGAEKQRLLAQAKSLGVENDFLLPGYVRNPASYLATADLFVLSSAYEGFPNVLAEALALGTPVVSTDCPHGPREILEDGRYGPLVPVGDADSLAAAIMATLANPLPKEQLKARGQVFSAQASALGYMRALGIESTSPEA